MLKPLRMFAYTFALAFGLAAVLRTAMAIYAIPSGSMSPTLVPGDQIVVSRIFLNDLERGEVIVFRSPEQDGQLMVKRIVAVPGDFVDSRLGHLRIGGYTVAEPYVRAPSATGALTAQLIPADSYFVLGDDRGDSVDSRRWGPIPKALVIGRARLVLWSSSRSWSASAYASDHSYTRPIQPAIVDTSSRFSRLFKCIE